MADYVTGYNNNYRLRLRMNARSRTTADTNANRTIVDWSLLLETRYNAINARTVGSITVGGTSQSIPMQTRNHGSNNTAYTIASGTRTVTHNSSGNASIWGGAHYYSENQTAAWRIPRIDVSGTLTLPRIPQLPNAPGTPSASQSTLNISVSWSAASGNGDSILEYRLRRRANPGGTYGGWTTVSTGTGRSLSFPPVSHGSNYQFQASARTSRGWGPWSGTRTITAKTQIPSAPSAAPTVSQGNIAISVTSAVASPNGVAVNQYQTRYRFRAGSSWSAWITLHTGASRATSFNPSTHGVAYEFQSRANAGYGWGPWSATRTLTVKSQIPNTPGAPSVSQSGLTITVTSPVTSPNGQPVTQYQVQRRARLSSGEWGGWTAWSASSSRTVTFTPANGTAYQFQARASAGYGWSSWGSITHFTSPTQIPNAPSGAPSSSQSTPNGTILFTSQTASPNGVPVTAYEIEWQRQNPNGSWTAWAAVRANASRQISLTPLHGHTYRARSRASQSYGWGPWSAIATRVSHPHANRPTLSEVQPNSARVSWTVNGNSAGGPRWTLQRASNSGFTSGVVTYGETSQYNLTMNGLQPGTTYYLRVRGANSGGTGSWSSTATLTTPPGSAPTISVVTSPNGTSATATVGPAGVSPSSYRVQWWRQDETGTIRTVQGATSTLQLTGLEPGTLYMARANVTVGAYTSPMSDWELFATPNPGAVTGEYFDGSSPSLSDLTYSWSATSHNSVSYARGQVPLNMAVASNIRAYGLPGQLVPGTPAGRLMRIQRVANSANNAWVRYDSEGGQDIPASEVVTYTHSMYVRASHDMTVRIRMISRGVGGNLLVDDADHELVANQITRIHKTTRTPPGTENIGTTLWIMTAPPGAFLDIDGSMLSPGGLLPFFDGDTQDTSANEYRWTGTPNDSFSEHVSLPVSFVDYFEDPSCPAPPAAPRPPQVENPCIEEVNVWRRYWVHINESLIKSHLDTLPTFTIISGALAEESVRIRIFENPDNLSIEEFQAEEWISEQILVNMPANARVVLDALTERASGSVNGSPWQSVDHLIFGSEGAPPTYPVLSCDTSYLVAFDVPVESMAGNLTFEAELVERYG